MIFTFISIIVPLVIAFGLPPLMNKAEYSERRYRYILYVGCFLFFIAYYLPSPLIEGRDTSFVTHLVGGGLFSGLLWIYLKCSLKWHQSLLLEAASLFGLVSALGSLNELAELAIKKFGINNLPLDDTNWDILANTIGAAIVFGAYELYRRYR